MLMECVPGRASDKKKPARGGLSGCVGGYLPNSGSGNYPQVGRPVKVLDSVGGFFERVELSRKVRDGLARPAAGDAVRALIACRPALAPSCPGDLRERGSTA